MRQIPITELSLNEAGVTCLLQCQFGFMNRSENRILRMNLVGTVNTARSGNGDGMLINGTALFVSIRGSFDHLTK
jgi:hypothetical protein